MKFTVDRKTLVKMVKQVVGESRSRPKMEIPMLLSACAARVFVSANGVVAGHEALVFEDGECSVPGRRFLLILRSFAPKRNLSFEAEPAPKQSHPKSLTPYMEGVKMRAQKDLQNPGYRKKIQAFVKEWQEHPSYKRNFGVKTADFLRIGGFSMPIANYSLHTVPPGDFRVYRVTDTWLAEKPGIPEK